MRYMLHNGQDGLCKQGCCRQDRQLNTYDWLADIPGNQDESNLVEVQFKNTRKGYYRNSYQIPLEKGDIVAVESTPGHDIGVVTLTGRLVPLQMKKANIRSEQDIKRVYRKAKQVDMEKYEEAKAREHSTMIRARQIALDLNLQMKIGDVEYQGDGNKAIFYYIADERVDFRQLIKVLADAFRVRIEMKQIGARQEAGRIGGIGPCGRELCCATWMTSFISVSTNAARLQDISLNPQKLAGQCAKLKCCLNYEIDAYVESQRRLPSREIQLETKDGLFYYFKADILAGKITYSTDKSIMANAVTISARRAFEVLDMNRKGIKPDSLEADGESAPKVSSDLLDQESLTRFDSRSKKEGKNKKKGKNGSQRPRPEGDRPDRKDKGPRPEKKEKGPRPQNQQNEASEGAAPAENGSQERKPQREGGNQERKDKGPRPERRDKGPRQDRQAGKNQDGEGQAGTERRERRDRDHDRGRKQNRGPRPQQEGKPQGAAAQKTEQPKGGEAKE